MCRGDRHRRKVCAKQPGLAIFEDNVTVADIGFSCAQRFYFPALQGETSLELFFDKVFVPGALIQRDGG
ncbi:Uncharacterised protein [Salmonella enterica subsp. enterica serovar Bovismorbificans]|uniref:Uncharacterized protein n=1 Tax=Salmonella enterica subsp. enterica serovar Bovismorbificans TaxID=58097 RepID=A0A655DT00_SALET|nr:hypothetical protein SEEM0047_00130 [Salmonella enterica subsp. enterica serovar Montevideo str. MB102109-0047]KJT60920.1 hypothetical protein SEEH3712_16441 [Salmonella enterica subsp. enterica serovar Heidelberg str. 622737-12]CNU33088.1 Uncharacterised protein [Salmonella enterica subsp. enterica serovar Bovismorbificans]CNU85600.1 Uncharacterised protein [Salmonella enterica subsp. enterica serovar Bovismorbificans]